jgi:hypothetical protein
MPLSDAEIADLCAAIYGYPGAPVVQWDHFDPGFDDGVCWALKRFPGYDVVIFRGSLLLIGYRLLPDWFRDIRAFPLFTRIGHVHEGFFQGMEKMWAELRPMIRQPVVVGGHSLGAARASDLTALMVMDGIPPALRVVFGEPKPGFQDHTDIVATVPGRSYRNGNDTDRDRVTDEPLLPEAYGRAPTLIDVWEPPANDVADDLDRVFRCHHIDLYRKAVARLIAAAAA